MKKRGLQPMTEEPVNVTPLIDIVMCLIIFFLICGKLVKEEVGEAITVPVARQGQELNDGRGRVVLNLSLPADYSSSTEARVIPQMFSKGQKVEYAQLTNYLRAAVAQNPDVRVILRADKNVLYEFIAPVLISCSEANIKSEHFSTVNK